MRQLSADEVAAVLERNHVGVLSLAGGPYPYPIPVAYGYAPDDRQLVVQLEGGEDSEKRHRLDRDGRVGLVVYEDDDEEWHSVLLQGELVEVPYRAAESAFASLAESTRFSPNPVVWSDLGADTPVQPYELDVARVAGRAFDA